MRASESDFYMAECFNPGGATCVLSGGCGLQAALGGATDAYLAVLDGETLASVMPRRSSQSSAVRFYSNPSMEETA